MDLRIRLAGRSSPGRLHVKRAVRRQEEFAPDALNIDLLAAFAGDVDLQGGCIPRQSSDSASGQRFYRAVLLL